MRIHSENPEESKRFVCTTCNNRFTRRHDLHRHGATIHGDRMPSSSISGKRRTRRKPSSTRHHPRDLIWLSSGSSHESGPIAGVLGHHS
ncbi:hypothetical protein BC826DRAFT_730405 [Russula brevipes]|nr:hypothetical protein BC826DRAFT_730405 [Russula brevipes]